jgi:hypothetical protein
LLTSSYFCFLIIQPLRNTNSTNKISHASDNSEVILNAASKLSFNEKKWADQRALTLEGEAFQSAESKL